MALNRPFRWFPARAVFGWLLQRTPLAELEAALSEASSDGECDELSETLMGLERAELAADVADVVEAEAAGGPRRGKRALGQRGSGRQLGRQRVDARGLDSTLERSSSAKVKSTGLAQNSQVDPEV
jgi:hypothetical protein